MFHRRWTQFRLRTLFVIVTLFCVWLGPHVRQADNQRRLLAAVAKLNGHAYFDYATYIYGFKAGWPSPVDEGRPWAPGWLRRLVGDEHFGTLKRLWFSGGISTADFQKIAPYMVSVDDLNVPASCFSDEGWRCLGKLTQLRYLNILKTPIDSPQIKYLRGLTELRGLNLDGTAVDDRAIGTLSGFTKLKWLSCYGTRITEDGLRRLKRSLPACIVRGSNRGKWPEWYEERPDYAARRERRDRLADESTERF